MHFVHLKTSGFLRVLRTRDRIVRSNTWFIHSLLARIRLWCSTGKGAAIVSSRGPRRPKARRAFADPIASLFIVPVSPLELS